MGFAQGMLKKMRKSMRPAELRDYKSVSHMGEREQELTHGVKVMMTKVRNYGGNVETLALRTQLRRRSVPRASPSLRLTLRMKTLRFPKSIPKMWPESKPHLAKQRKISISWIGKHLNG